MEEPFGDIEFCIKTRALENPLIRHTPGASIRRQGGVVKGATGRRGQPREIPGRVTDSEIPPLINSDDIVILDQETPQLHEAVNHRGFELPQARILAGCLPPPQQCLRYQARRGHTVHNPRALSERIQCALGWPVKILHATGRQRVNLSKACAHRRGQNRRNLFRRGCFPGQVHTDTQREIPPLGPASQPWHGKRES